MNRRMFFALASLVFTMSPVSTCAQNNDNFGFGLLFMAGGRYDNLRMCVASPAGAQGGPIGDVMLTARYPLGDRAEVGLNVPLMRPILFGAAFKMLQFEPEVQIDFRNATGNGNLLFVAPSLGVSLHYGPDYTSDLQNPKPSFFAAGPIAGAHLGIGFAGNPQNTFAIKPFFAALFAKDRDVGTVIGAALEYLRQF